MPINLDRLLQSQEQLQFEDWKVNGDYSSSVSTLAVDELIFLWIVSSEQTIEEKGRLDLLKRLFNEVSDADIKRLVGTKEYSGFCEIADKGCMFILDFILNISDPVEKYAMFLSDEFSGLIMAIEASHENFVTI